MSFLDACCPCGLFGGGAPEPASKYKVDEPKTSSVITTSEGGSVSGGYPPRAINPENFEEQFQKTFHEISGEAGTIEPEQLHHLLTTLGGVEFKFEGFSPEVCRSMVALMDTDLTGNLGFKEARMLCLELEKWKVAFMRFDVDKSGQFNGNELHNLLRYLDFNLNERSLKALNTRYSDKEGNMVYNNFVACMVKLTAMYDIFMQNKNNNTEKANFNSDEFLQLTMYS